MNLHSKILFYITQVDGFRKLIGRFGRDMIMLTTHIKLQVCLILWPQRSTDI